MRHAKAGFHRLWLRSMRYAGWMDGERAFAYASPAHEVPAYIKQNLIALQIAVVVRSRNGVRMIIDDRGTNEQTTKF